MCRIFLLEFKLFGFIHMNLVVILQKFKFLWSDPEPDPDLDHLIGSGSRQKVRIRADPDPQHWLCRPKLKLFRKDEDPN